MTSGFMAFKNVNCVIVLCTIAKNQKCVTLFPLKILYVLAGDFLAKITNTIVWQKNVVKKSRIA
jgi:hypothetical protein